MYVGFAVNLIQKLYIYYSILKLTESESESYNYNTLLHHGYSKFSLIILEYIDIINLSKEKSKN